ncbi:hypothetical protein SEA_FUZZBUSTER_44 [Microbacterium phage FuzzBuster]|uniref:Minor tail protein n=1 Tax=Microbacterium phage FuzzBuster TaxID=2590935 RepID=A0A516KV15_9CAUD|nr:hypothetical protein SEA_FUZZBUSTER_44 [Microbacterium phage FuzzBuster]
MMTDRSQAGFLKRIQHRLTAVERRLARGAFSLPPRLEPVGEAITDWNDAVAVGYYSALSAAANAPAALPLVGVVTYEQGSGTIAQEVWSPSANPNLRALTWRRVYTTGAWSTWKQTPEVFYSERASGNIASITTSWVQITPISITVTLTRAGRLRFSANAVSYSSSVGDVVVLELRDGATGIQSWTHPANSSPTAAATGNGLNFECILPVAAGTHTYTLWVARAAGSGSITIAPSAVNLCWLSVEQVS